MKNGESKGSCFAGAGLGKADYVASGKRRGNSGRLNGGGMSVTEFGTGGLQLGGER